MVTSPSLPPHEGWLRFARRDRVAVLLLLAAATAPWAVARIKTQSQAAAGMSAIDVGRGLACAVALALGLIVAWPRLARRRPGQVEIGLAAFAVWCFASTAWSVDHRDTLLQAGLIALCYVALVGVSRLHATRRELLTTLTAYTVMLVVATAVGAVVARGGAYHPIPPGQDPTPRLFGQFPQLPPNYLAIVCVVALAGCLVRLVPAWLSNPWLRGAVVALAAGELLLTRSRIAAALGVCLLLWLLARRRGVRVALVVAVLLGAAVAAGVAVAGPGGLTRHQSSSNLVSLTGRTDHWTTAFHTFERHPVVGDGYYSGHRFGVDYAHHLQDPVSNLDNTWLETAVDTGAIGLLLLLVAVGCGVASAIRVVGPRDLADDTLLGLSVLMLADSVVNSTVQSVAGATLVVMSLLLLSPSRRASRADAISKESSASADVAAHFT